MTAQPSQQAGVVAGPSRGTVNALTVDVEDYFQVSAFAPFVSRDDWALPANEVVRIRESVIYEGCCFSPPDVALMGSYRTEIAWDETDCP